MQDHEQIDAKIQAAMTAHADKHTAQLDARMKELRDMFSSAFPDGDPSGHRTYHEAQIKYMEERVKLWQDIRGKTLAGVVWLGLLALGTAVWEYVKAAVSRGSH